MGFTVDVAGEVFGGPAGFEEFLLEAAALGGRDGDGVVVDARTKQFSYFATGELGKDGGFFRLEDEPVGGVRLEADAAVARHGFGDIDKQRLRDREPGVGFEDIDDLLGVVSGGAGIP